MSVFHLDHAAEKDRSEVETVAYADNWRFWTYAFKTGKADLKLSSVLTTKGWSLRLLGAK